MHFLLEAGVGTRDSRLHHHLARTTPVAKDHNRPRPRPPPLRRYKQS